MASFLLNAYTTTRRCCRVVVYALLTAVGFGAGYALVLARLHAAMDHNDATMGVGGPAPAPWRWLGGFNPASGDLYLQRYQESIWMDEANVEMFVFLALVVVGLCMLIDAFVPWRRGDAGRRLAKRNRLSRQVFVGAWPVMRMDVLAAYFFLGAALATTSELLSTIQIRLWFAAQPDRWWASPRFAENVFGVLTAFDVALLVVALAALTWWVDARMQRRAWRVRVAQRWCRHCGYRRAAAQAACPECGQMHGPHRARNDVLVRQWWLSALFFIWLLAAFFGCVLLA
jgi:hypothetical protein